MNKNLKIKTLLLISASIVLVGGVSNGQSDRRTVEPKIESPPSACVGSKTAIAPTAQCIGLTNVINANAVFSIAVTDAQTTIYANGCDKPCATQPLLTSGTASVLGSAGIRWCSKSNDITTTEAILPGNHDKSSYSQLGYSMAN